MTRRAAVVERPIDVAALMAEAADPSVGAVSVFLGTVRDVGEQFSWGNVSSVSADAEAGDTLIFVATQDGESSSTPPDGMVERADYPDGNTLTLADEVVGSAGSASRSGGGVDRGHRLRSLAARHRQDRRRSAC